MAARVQEAFRYLYRIVDAMLDDARNNAFCIATDATGAPVRAKGERACVRHHVFVFVADQRHVIFRHAPEHTGQTVRTWLGGFRGYLLADASSIDDVIYRQGAVVEVGCWAHLRRYFWRALPSAPERATEAIARIGRLFEIEREYASMARPERTKARAKRARPVLKLLDDWVSRHRGEADPRSPRHAALTYYDHQREALRRFLVDGRQRLDNNVSEGPAASPRAGPRELDVLRERDGDGLVRGVPFADRVVPPARAQPADIPGAGAATGAALAADEGAGAGPPTAGRRRPRG